MIINEKFHKVSFLWNVSFKNPLGSWDTAGWCSEWNREMLNQNFENVVAKCVTSYLNHNILKYLSYHMTLWHVSLFHLWMRGVYRANCFQNTLIPVRISNYIQYKVRDDISHPFLNLNGATVEVWEWVKCFHHTLYWACDYLSMLGLKLIHVNKRRPMSRRFTPSIGVSRAFE